MSAFERQEGGGHYKAFKIQPAEFIQQNKLDWCQGNIVKYVTRFRFKGGKTDLDKARHYLDMLEELEYGAKTQPDSGYSPESVVPLSDSEKTPNFWQP